MPRPKIACLKTFSIRASRLDGEQAESSRRLLQQQQMHASELNGVRGGAAEVQSALQGKISMLEARGAELSSTVRKLEIALAESKTQLDAGQARLATVFDSCLFSLSLKIIVCVHRLS